MLSIYASSGSIVDESRIRNYFHYLMKDKHKMGVRSAGIVYKNGNVADRTSKFKMTRTNLQEIARCLDSEEAEKISFNNVTYCLKYKASNQLMCFNGNNYLVVAETEVTYIIVLCTSREKSSSVASVVNKVARTMRQNDL